MYWKATGDKAIGNTKASVGRGGGFSEVRVIDDDAYVEPKRSEHQSFLEEHVSLHDT